MSSTAARNVPLVAFVLFSFACGGSTAPTPTGSTPTGAGGAAGSGTGASGPGAAGGATPAGGGSGAAGAAGKIANAGSAGSAGIGGSTGQAGSGQAGLGSAGFAQGGFGQSGVGGGSAQGGFGQGGVGGGSTQGGFGGFGPGQGGGGSGQSGFGQGQGGGASPTPPVACADDPACAVPPLPTSGAPPAQGSAPVKLAISVLLVGDVDPNGVASPTAWEGYGFNIDGLHFTKLPASGHCIPVLGAKPSDMTLDGAGGVDNSFGKNIVPILLGLSSDLAVKIQDGIDAGRGTEMLLLDGLDAAPDAIAVMASFQNVVGAPDGMGGTIAPPAGNWSGYSWRRFAGDVAQDFNGSYVTKNTWVSGATTGTTTFPLSFAGYDLPLVVHQSRMTLPLAVDHASGKGGKVGGVLSADELAAAIKLIAGSVSPSLCQGNAIDGVLAQIRQASDIMLDGTQDPGATCDGISIGLGFDALLSQVAATPVPKPTPKNPCM